jgi:hypothetical protein
MSITSTVKTLLHRIAGKRSFNETVAAVGGIKTDAWGYYKDKTLAEVGRVLFQNGVRFASVDPDAKFGNMPFSMEELAREEREEDAKANPPSHYVGKGPDVAVKLEPAPKDLVNTQSACRTSPHAVSPLMMDILTFYVLVRFREGMARNYECDTCGGPNLISDRISDWPPAQQECIRRLVDAGLLEMAYHRCSFGTNTPMTQDPVYRATNKALWVLARASETVGRCL